jgi:hypothetical protein
LQLPTLAIQAEQGSQGGKDNLDLVSLPERTVAKVYRGLALLRTYYKLKLA